MEVCKVSYRDFILWTNKDFAVKRIAADSQFLDNVIDGVQHFFVCSVLPEIVGKWYTGKPIDNSEGVIPIPSSQDADEQQDSDDYEGMSKLGATVTNQALVT